MNKIYRLKFDRRRNELVAVSEITAGTGKEKNTGHIAGLCDVSTFRKLVGTLTPLAFLTGLIISLFPVVALANPDLPTGGQIVGGQGSISTSGNQMTIHQQTQNMATNWHSFDIGQNNTVQFVQPDSSSVALNRVTGASGSQIMGTLKANGQVFILNPNGVLFGKDARVNVAGLVASTKNINTADFMKGQYTLSGEGNPGAQVINQGSLTTTKGGYIVLAADQVKNSGTITTPSGKTVLAAGKTVTLQLDNGGLTSVSVDGSVVNALVDNRGLISATNGQVFLTARGKDILLNTVVNNSGTIEAKGLESRGGEIVLNGGDSGVVNQTGQLLADSHAGPGGKITVEGQNIHLAANSRTSATGKTGGGEVYVGGGWQGKDSHIRNASKVVMDKTATVDVSATDAGNGGTAVLWSDDYTNFRGAILAKGGALSGDGGRVETSSHKNLQAFGDVDTSASAGRGGEWLLDPLDVTIVSGDANTGVTESGKGAGGATLDTDTDHVFSPSASGAQVSAQKISDQLNNGTSVTVETHGDGSQAGNITFNKDASVKKDKGGDATLTLKADRDISFGNTTWSSPTDKTNGAIVSTAGKLNLNLLTGNDGQDGTATFGKFVRLHLNGGDAFIGPANLSAGNASVSFGSESSVDAGNITLNTAGGVTGGNYGLNADKNLTVNGPLSLRTSDGVTSEFKAGGLLKITAGTGDISFSAPDKSTGGKILIEGKDGVDISADNGHLVMNAADTVKNTINISSSDGPVNLSGIVHEDQEALTLTNVSISSKGQTTLNGTTDWGKAAVLSGLNITADGDVNINGISPGRASALGVNLSGSSITSTTGNITVTGVAATDKSHPDISTLTVSNSNLTANGTTGRIVLNGTTETTTGVKVTSSNLSSASLDVKGVATIQGTGFTLTNSHLLGGLADLSSVTFSSAGSAAGVTNQLDSSIVTAGNRATLLKWHPENMTQIDMGGSAIFDDSRETDKGWVANFTSDTTPNGGWIFNNTKVIAGGTVDLKGAGFTNATVTVSDGDLNINNAGPAMLQGTTFSMANGGVHVHSKAGNINLTNGKISAKNDISLNADNGSVIINGDTITSTDGNISVNADATKNGNVDGVSLGDSSLSAGQGINITGTTGGQKSQDGVAGVKFQGNVNLTSTENVIDGKSVARVSWNKTSGVSLYGETHVVFVGDTTINAESESFSGFLFNAGYSSGESVEFRNGSSVINATDRGNLSPDAPSDFDDLGGMAINAWGGQRRDVEFKVSNASLNITSESMGAARGGMMSYSLTGDGPGELSRGSGYIFTGQGDISIKGTSAKGAGVDLRVLDNRGLNGRFTVNGESESGVGVIVPEFADVNVVNAAVSGSSDTGVGIQLNSSDSNAKEINLQGNTLTGTSVSGSSGIQIKGNNVSVTNGTVNGTVSNGTGTGVLLYGNTDYTISGATVTGQSVDGAGVSAGGSLTVNDGAVLKGTVTGSGSGVVINGDLKITDGRNVVIAGKAESGDGIQIAGNSSLINASLAGESATGTGVNVAQNLTVSGTSTIKGTSDKNTGVSIARNLTVIPVTDSGGAIISQASITGESGASGTGVTLGAGLKGGDVTGISVSGTGVELADNADIKQATLKGNSTKGSGVTVSGKVTLDDTTAKALAAGSDSGSGLTLSEGADVHIVQDGTTEPVTDAVVLSGTSGTGSAVTVDGNAAISGVILKGETTAGNGTGVTVKNGKLTLSDALSGVEAGATGNGTGLVISDGAVDAGGYKEAGKDFVIGTTVTGDGTAISISGNSSLSNVALNGTATGNGSAVVVSGSLSTDKTLTATSQGQEGTGLQLSGGHLQGTATDNTPVKVVVSSTGDGTAVRVTKSDTGQSGSGLSGITLAASAGRGPVLDIAGDLVTNADISVSTENGTAISLNGGSLQGADAGHPVTVTADATGSGTAVTVKPVAEGQPGSTLANVTLNVTSVQGDALNVGGKLNTKDVSVAAATTGAGTALNVSGGEIHSLGGTDITATSDSGHAAVVNDGKFTGDSSGGLEVTATTTTDSPALNISGASEVSNSVLSGKNSGNGSAVTVAGTVTSSGGGEIKGQTVNGTAVETADGTSVTAAQDGGLLINASATGDKGTGVVLTNATLTGSRVHADVTQGDAVTVTGSLTGGKVSGYADGGNGLNISNAVLSDTSLSGTTQTGKGTVVAGSLKADANSSVSGTATEDGGDGVSVSGSVTGGKTEGHATGGTAVSVAEGSTFTDTVVNGEATTGTGVSVAGEATLTNAVLNGTTQTGTGAAISGTFTGDKTSQVTGVATQDGGTGVTVSGSVTGGKVDGHATSGAGVHLDTGTTLNNVAVSGGTESGKGVDIAGGLVSTGATTIAGHSTGAGTGVDVAGNITGGSVTGNADGTGTGVTVSGQNVTVSDVVVSGNTEDGTGVLVSGGLSGSGTVVNGQATGGGTGVQINGTLAAGIKGSSSSGTGVLVSDGANIASGSHADGSSVSGTGVVTQGNVANHGSITGQSGTGTGAGIGGSVTGQGHITGTTNGTGNGVNLAGNVSGGTVAGHSAGGTGVSVTDTSVLADATVSGDTLNGTGVHVTGSLTGTGATTVTGTSTGSGTGAILSGNVTGGIVNGNSADGVGVSTEQMLTLNGVTVNGTSASQNGVLVSGHVESTGATMITGSSASDAGVRLNGTVSGGSLTGHSVSGPGVHVTGDSHLNGVEVSSSSESGEAIQTDAPLSSSDSTLNGQTLPDMSVPDMSVPDTSGPDTSTPDTIRQAVYREQGVTSHTERLSHPAKASGPQGQDKPVSVEICEENRCSTLVVPAVGGAVGP
ncbi:filamentous hemagglutinin N-terminal domain-containing protein [Salmonella enterica subsp. enterica serovar Apeyeme]|nr:filamentous hemagglutinin N-terminal domain-containing protein [Salmonella enterica subsp. enterica serovar Apeyeme]